ncbi:hypothetical protein V6N12_028812 [Hibiscus sabdariffa]|uniref:Uncharacterized protein n=1 Tax=Hibiscus sabdariffa TaxID=183260 RepID=A0ABR2F706_9ROSI
MDIGDPTMGDGSFLYLAVRGVVARELARIFDAENVERESVLAKGCLLINECEVAFVSSRSLPRIVARDTLAVLERTQSMEGAIFAMPSDMVTGIVTDEKRYWDDHRRAAISPPQYYRRMDPRG